MAVIFFVFKSFIFNMKYFFERRIIMKKWKKYLLFVFIMSVILFVPSKQNVRADTANSYDSNMQTQRYDTYVRVGKDGSYTVTESIGVVFLNPRCL